MKERKNNLVKVTVITLLITMIGIILISGTYSKYTSNATGSDSARVAKWSFKVNEKDIAKETFTVDLFNTITNTNETEETAVAATDGSLIAPGTMGSFFMDVKNESEVTASYTVTYELTNASNIPLEFSTNKTDWSTDIESVQQAATTLAIGTTGKTTTVYWRWAFNGNDSIDTALGVASTAATAENPAPTAVLTATITATQVD